MQYGSGTNLLSKNGQVDLAPFYSLRFGTILYSEVVNVDFEIILYSEYTHINLISLCVLKICM